MRYFYIHPFRPQYFFQKECRKYSFFRTFFQPYTIKGAISWWLYWHTYLYSLIFSKKNIEKYVPELRLRSIIGNNAVLAINAGSPGPEQKITLIGLHNDTPFFSKYARTETAVKLVENERVALTTIKGKGVAPDILDHFSGTKISYIKTEFLIGKRVSIDLIDEKVISLLKKISLLDVMNCFHVNSTLTTSFSHGDFCPWNLMIVGGTIKAFDWEMSGYYTFGYDLFTYIFQTSFLLHPKRKIEKIVLNNQHHFFDFFGETDWKPYLAAFANTKLDIESQKNNRRLIPHYKRLSEYAKKA